MSETSKPAIEKSAMPPSVAGSCRTKSSSSSSQSSASVAPVKRTIAWTSSMLQRQS